MTIQEIKDILAAAGTVGAGGAGFPSGFKLAEGADTLIINAAECEPLLYTDYVLMKRHMDRVTGGAELMMEAAGIKRGYLGVKKHTAERLGLVHDQSISEHIRVYALPDVYPMGDEIILIYEVLRRVVQPGSLPLSAGVLVFNVETLCNVYKAVHDGVPVTEKWVTLGGKIAHPVVVKVPVGTKVSTLLEKHHITVPEDCVLLDGGPAMGPVIDPNKAVITKTTKGLLVLPKEIPAVVSKLSPMRVQLNRATSACCQCTLCTEMCPRALIGYPLKPHKTVRSVSAYVTEDPGDYLTAALCCSCGVCELMACCQGISPRRVYQEIKAEMAKNGLRYQYKGQNPIDPERDNRMVPVERFKQRIGVAPFDTVAEFEHSDGWKPDTIVLPLKQHVGAPATPLVTAGDTVAAGQMVAGAAKGISASIHSSIAGRVVSVDNNAIVISRS